MGGLLHSSLYLVFIQLTVLSSLVRSQSTEDGPIHFSDSMNGRLAWVVEDNELPWSGSFHYLSSLNIRTALLTVADSSTGIPLGECSTNSFGDKWEQFSWTLSSTDLLCTVSQTNSSRLRFVPSSSDSPRSFSVRIQASRGPRCMSSISIQGDKPNGCPPILSKEGFSQLSLQCGCPHSTQSPPPSSPSSSPSHPSFNSFPSPSTPSSPPIFPRVQLGSFPNSQEVSSSPSTIHPCTTHPCSNDGRCIVNDAGFAQCECTDGFAGRHCEVDVCAQVPCGNGGRCSAKGTIAVCHCPKHTRGLLCEEIVCDPLCSNGGICQLKEGEAICDCPEGFTGPNCNVVDVCLGNAACTVFGPSAVCHIEESAVIAPRAQLLKDTPFDCKCPQEGDLEWIDCINLHTSPSPSISTTTLSSIPSSSSNSSLIIPPLSPLFPNLSTSTQQTLPFNPNLSSSQGFLPNPSFGSRPSSTISPSPSPSPSLPPHQFTSHTVIPPLSSIGTSEEEGSDNIPFNPSLSIQSTSSPSSILLPTNEVRITLPPHRPTHLIQPEVSSPPSTEDVPSVSVPILPYPNHNNNNGQLPFVPFEQTTTIPPTTSFASISSTEEEETTVSFIPTDLPSVSIDAIEVTSSPPEIVPTTTTTVVPMIHPVAPLEEVDPFESIVTSTVGEEEEQTTVEEEEIINTTMTPTTTTTEEITTTIEEETDAPIVETPPPFIPHPIEDKEEEEVKSEEEQFVPETRPPFIFSTIPSTPSTTLPSLTTQPSLIFSRPRIPSDSSSSSSSSSDGSSDRQEGSAAASWIVAIVAIVVLGLLLVATALVVLRYVRQSRKLHGKYNPAREEHALSSAYAMPMSSVTKEERLI